MHLNNILYSLSLLVAFCSLKEFNSLIAEWKLKPQDGETEESCPWKISDQELTIQKSKVGELCPMVDTFDLKLQTRRFKNNFKWFNSTEHSA